MSHKLYLIILLVFFIYSGNAQIGGEYTYQFLELTSSARVAALGGTQVALNDTSDLNLSFFNPSLLHKGMSHLFLVNYVNYFAGVVYGYASYSRNIKRVGNFALGMNYINYGVFKEATGDGGLTGNHFKAAEYALNMIYANNYRRLSYGVNIKPIFSVFESYRSFGLAGDFGITFSSKDSLTHVGVVARNIGGQLTSYYDNGETEPIPFNLQAGISSRLRHAPVILSLTMQHLTNWELAWDESEKELSLESWYERQESFAKQLIRHAVLGVEILPTDNFSLRAGYNYQRRQELKFEERISTVGLSMGFGLIIKRFRFDFATSRFHLAGSSNIVSIAVNLNDRF